jgi:hypothetical protein
MEKDFVTYEQSIDLRDLGFDESHFGLYGKSEDTLYKVIGDKFDVVDDIHFIKSPLYQQAFRWFREKYDLDSFVKHVYKSTIKVGYYFGIDKYKGVEFQTDFNTWYNTYEEAEQACLDKLIEIVKNK